MTTPDQLRAIPWFAGLPKSRLEWLAAEAQSMTLAAGDFLLRQGDAATGFYVLLSGTALILQHSGNQETVAGVREAPCFLGEISVLTGKPIIASCRAQVECDLLWWSEDAFFELLGSCRQFARSMFSTMTERTSETESISREVEKMASLGTLAAGLAHELNNPASAAVRSLSRAQNYSADIYKLTSEMAAVKGCGAVISQLSALSDTAIAGKNHDALGLADAEDALGEWLDGKGVEDAWALASVFAEGGITSGDLQNIMAELDGIDAAKALHWAGAVMDLRRLIDESRSACGRISDLVKAMKSYSYMDQGITQEVDIHAGIDDTLTILKHKIQAGVDIRRDYAADLPKATVYGSELNQVWTNILDNALDALKDGGTIDISTHSEGERVIVMITDNGPGIPEDIQGKVFDPFFTTKAVGQGTGLGLDISYRIVVSRHCGCLDLTSRPGETRFTITLPVTPPECADGSAEHA